jgi:hypothetical protein
LRERILDPVLDQLADSHGVFDEQTQDIIRELKKLDDLAQLSQLALGIDDFGGWWRQKRESDQGRVVANRL